MVRARGGYFAALLLAAALAVGAAAHGHLAGSGAAALHAAHAEEHAALPDCAHCAGGGVATSVAPQIALRAADCGAQPGRSGGANAPRCAVLLLSAAPRAPPVFG